MKYEFTGETCTIREDGELRTLQRIRRLIDGLVGGWIESAANLSQSGDCFVYDSAKVYGEARIVRNAAIRDTARVYDTAKVGGYAEVFGSARIYGDAYVYSKAKVSGHAQIYGNAFVGSDAVIDAKSYVSVNGGADIGPKARISYRKDVLWFSNVGTEHGTLTMYKAEDGVRVTRGCFGGTVEKFLSASKRSHGPAMQAIYKGLIEAGLAQLNYMGEE